MPELPTQRTAPRGGPPHEGLTVLHLAQPVEGGVARVVADLARAQVEAGLHVVVACPAGGELADAAAAAGARTLHWPAVREPGARIAVEVYTVQRLLHAVRPDLVHAHSAKAGLAARLAVRGRVPTVYQPHAWSFEAATGRTAHLARAWERYAARWSDRVLCVSEAERATGTAVGIEARWAVVHNGVDTARFTASAAPRTGRWTAPGPEPWTPALAAVAELPPSAVLVVCVGRLCEQKGQRTLLRAWPQVAARVPDARLVLVGDGPDREELRRAAPAGVVFAGASGAVADWYAAADLVVLPSLWEGMALTPLEAMASRRPVLVSDVAGSRELLPPGQQADCLVPPADPDALAQAVARLALAPRLRAELADAAHAHVRERFDITTTTTAVLELYRDVLRHRTATAAVPAAEGAGSR
ncbi:glycosyltransferase family 4 protein [Streptomyces sp. NPDC006784]|uniref:glycosyltransferase family 4 protein n=1 Tax=Streptomyces sp. NPDC006784 TaxID=3364764 RepID=UPI003673764A